MPDIFELITRWWKRILAVMLLSLLAVGTITFLKRPKYLSVTTAVAASSFGSDKAKIFNENIEGLYSTLGSADDLDKILGTANLDTVYLSVARAFNLFDHYKIKGSKNKTLIKAAAELKENTRVVKSEYGELKVKVWDTDKNLAPQLADAVMDKLHSIHINLQGAGNEATLNALIMSRQKMLDRPDSSGKPPAYNVEIATRLKEYEKLIGQYQMMVDSKPPVLVIVEKARAAVRPDKPKRVQIMVATTVLSFLFALLAALAVGRRKNIV